MHQILGEHCTLVIYGNAEQEKEMLDTIQYHPNTFVLFPSPNSSITLEELMANEKSEDKTSTVQPSNYNIVVLDGTWKQAKAMSNHLPRNFPRVRLATSQPTISKLRKQSSPDRVTTAEATARILEEMQEDPVELTKIWECIQKRIDQADLQSGRASLVKADVNERDKDTRDLSQKKRHKRNNSKSGSSEEKKRDPKQYRKEPRLLTQLLPACCLLTSYLQNIYFSV